MGRPRELRNAGCIFSNWNELRAYPDKILFDTAERQGVSQSGSFRGLFDGRELSSRVCLDSLLGRGGGGLFGLVMGMIFVVLGAFIIVPIALFVWSGVLHLCLLLVGGANEGYQATFRVVSYSSVTSLFNAIPVVGTIASLWGIVLTVIGLREVHNTSTGKSVAAVLMPVGVAILLAIGAIAMGAFATANWSIPFLSKSSQSQALSTEVCAALEDYIAKIDAIKEQDPVSAPAQAQQAMTELEEVLSRFEAP